MNTTKQTLPLYEQRIKGLKECLNGAVQLWYLHDGWWDLPTDMVWPLWPNDYVLMALLYTDNVLEAFQWAFDEDMCFKFNPHVFILPPSGDDIFPTPEEPVFGSLRPVKTGDVFVTLQRVAYVVQDIGLRRLTEL